MIHNHMTTLLWEHLFPKPKASQPEAKEKEQNHTNRANGAVSSSIDRLLEQDTMERKAKDKEGNRTKQGNGAMSSCIDRLLSHEPLKQKRIKGLRM